MNARLLAVALVVSAGSAGAQNYTVSSQSLAYAPIVGGTNITFGMRDAMGFYTADDEGYVNLPLGFTFPYPGGNSTSNVYAHSNGSVTLNGAGVQFMNNGGTPGDP